MQPGGGIVLWTDFWREIAALVAGGGAGGGAGAAAAAAAASSTPAAAEGGGGLSLDLTAALAVARGQQQPTDSPSPLTAAARGGLTAAVEVAEAARPRSDSDIAREMQARWQAEEEAFASGMMDLDGPPALVTVPVPAAIPTAVAPAAAATAATAAAPAATAAPVEAVPFECRVCTFLNLEGARASCEMCGTAHSEGGGAGAGGGAGVGGGGGGAGSKRPRQASGDFGSPALGSSSVDEVGLAGPKFVSLRQLKSRNEIIVRCGQKRREKIDES